jgi:hypothetical protein
MTCIGLWDMLGLQALWAWELLLLIWLARAFYEMTKLPLCGVSHGCRKKWLKNEQFSPHVRGLGHGFVDVCSVDILNFPFFFTGGEREWMNEGLERVNENTHPNLLFIHVWLHSRPQKTFVHIHIRNIRRRHLTHHVRDFSHGWTVICGLRSSQWSRPVKALDWPARHAAV